MNPYKLREIYKYLTRAKKVQPDLPNVFPASKAPIPAKTQNVEEIEAVNQFMLRNPRVEKAGGGRIGFKDGPAVKFDNSRVKIPTGEFIGEGRDKSQIFKIKNNKTGSIKYMTSGAGGGKKKLYNSIEEVRKAKLDFIPDELVKTGSKRIKENIQEVTYKNKKTGEIVIKYKPFIGPNKVTIEGQGANTLKEAEKFVANYFEKNPKKIRVRDFKKDYASKDVRKKSLKETDRTKAEGTKKFNYHHIRQIAGGVPLTTDDVMIINQRINSALGTKYNQPLNAISAAIQKNNRLALEAMNNKKEGLALDYMRRVDELNAQAEKIVNSAIDTLPEKYKGYVGFNQFELPRDEYGLPIQKEPMIIKKIGGMPVSNDAIDLTTLNLKQEKEFNKIVKAQAEAGKVGPINKTKLSNLLKVMEKAEPQTAKQVGMVLNSGIPINQMAAEIAKIPGAKKFASGFMKIGGPFEVAFLGLDIANEVSKGAPLDTSIQQGLANISFGALGNPKKYQMRDLKDAADELGVNTQGFQELKDILDLEKKIVSEKKLLEDMKVYNEQTGASTLKGNFDVTTRSTDIQNLEKLLRDKSNQLNELANIDTLFDDYVNSVQYLGRKEYNKTIDTKKEQVYPEMGSMGSDFITTILNPIQSFLPQNLMETGLGPINKATQPIVRNLRKIPFVGSIFDPTSDQAKLSAMSQEEKDQRALDLNIVKQNYHPVMGQTMTGDQLAPYYDKFFAGGGIAKLAGDSSGVAPTSGPNPQGLLSLKNRVRNY